MINAGVDAVYASEGVDINLEIRKRLVGTGLKRSRVATGIWVEGMYAGQYCVAVFSGSASTSIGVDIACRIPISLHHKVR